MIQSLLIANRGEIARWIIPIFAPCLLCATAAAATPERASIKAVIIGYFTATTGRDRDAYARAVWSGSPLAQKNNPFGAVIHDDFRLNDIRIWISGNRAVVSAHTSEARYNPEGSDGLRGPRDICARQLELRRRKGEWRLHQITQVQCHFVEKQKR